MADRDDLDFTYSLIDRIFRLSLDELADFSGAKYDGDFSLTLEQAQRRKHEYIAEHIGNRARRTDPRSRPRLGSAAVHLRDAREMTAAEFGTFDAVASLGAFEHFCSPEDHASTCRRWSTGAT
jgi:cyclopropane-fatty-acyl-phospholipid synthase